MEEDFKNFCRRRLPEFLEYGPSFSDGLQFNPSFSAGIVKSLEGFFGMDLERFRHSEKYVQKLHDSLASDSPFMVPGYFSSLERAQSGRLKYTVNGDSENISYVLRINKDNHIRLKYSNKTKQLNILVRNVKLQKEIEYIVNEGKEKITAPYFSDFVEALKLFQFYKPFFLRKGAKSGCDSPMIDVLAKN